MQPVLWWLGDRGFALRYYDIVFYIDPPRAEAPLSPDMILCTRALSATVSALLAANPRAKVVIPRDEADSASQAGIPYSRMTTTDNGLRVEYFKNGAYVRVYAVPSEPVGLGYLIRCGEFTIFHSGECVPYEGLANLLRPYNVSVA